MRDDMYNDRKDCGDHKYHSNNKAPRSLRVYEYYAMREPTSSSFATAWPSLPRPTMWDYQNEFEFHQSPDEPFLLQAVRKWIPEVRRHRPGAPVVLVATQASPCHKHHKSSTLVVVTVISRKSTVTKILHPDRPPWLPSITFPPGEEPWHTQVATRLIVQVLVVLSISTSMSVGDYGELNTPH